MSDIGFLTGEDSRKAWGELADHLNKWFYKPDLEALSICLAAWVNHQHFTNMQEV